MAKPATGPQQKPIVESHTRLHVGTAIVATLATLILKHQPWANHWSQGLSMPSVQQLKDALIAGSLTYLIANKLKPNTDKKLAAQIAGLQQEKLAGKLNQADLLLRGLKAAKLSEKQSFEQLATKEELEQQIQALEEAMANLETKENVAEVKHTLKTAMANLETKENAQEVRQELEEAMAKLETKDNVQDIKTALEVELAKCDTKVHVKEVEAAIEARITTLQTKAQAKADKTELDATITTLQTKLQEELAKLETKEDIEAFKEETSKTIEGLETKEDASLLRKALQEELAKFETREAVEAFKEKIEKIIGDLVQQESFAKHKAAFNRLKIKVRGLASRGTPLPLRQHSSMITPNSSVDQSYDSDYSVRSIEEPESDNVLPPPSPSVRALSISSSTTKSPATNPTAFLDGSTNNEGSDSGSFLSPGMGDGDQAVASEKSEKPKAPLQPQEKEIEDIVEKALSNTKSELARAVQDKNSPLHQKTKEQIIQDLTSPARGANLFQYFATPQQGGVTWGLNVQSYVSAMSSQKSHTTGLDLDQVEVGDE